MSKLGGQFKPKIRRKALHALGRKVLAKLTESCDLDRRWAGERQGGGQAVATAIREDPWQAPNRSNWYHARRHVDPY